MVTWWFGVIRSKDRSRSSYACFSEGCSSTKYLPKGNHHQQPLRLRISVANSCVSLFMLFLWKWPKNASHILRTVAPFLALPKITIVDPCIYKWTYIYLYIYIFKSIYVNMIYNIRIYLSISYTLMYIYICVFSIVYIDMLSTSGLGFCQQLFVLRLIEGMWVARLMPWRSFEIGIDPFFNIDGWSHAWPGRGWCEFSNGEFGEGCIYGEGAERRRCV